MPLTVRKFSAQVRDSNTGDMIPAGLLSSDALSAIDNAKDDAISDIQAKGEETLATIPDDYTELTNKVVRLKNYLSESDNNIAGIEKEVDDAFRDIEETNGRIDSVNSNISELVTNIGSKVSKPSVNPNGTAGQVLQTEGDGTTSWVNPVTPDPEDVAVAVEEYLIEHPDVLDNEASEAMTFAGELYNLVESDRNIDKEIQYQCQIYERWKQRLKDYADCFIQSNGIGFIFFTDPHNVSGRYGATQYTLLQDFKYIKSIYEETPAKWVLCGGDWLNVYHQLSDAMLMVGRVPNLMRSCITENSYTVIGNHDPNAEGGIGKLTHEQLARIWYDSDVGYFTLTSDQCTCYMLDMGYSIYEVNSYQKAEAAWFANKLLNETKPHLFGVGHIPGQSDGSFFGDVITSIARAYNNRTTITYDGNTYDFSGATGTFHFIMGGHYHADGNETINGIPIIYTTTFAAYNLEHPRPLDCCFADFQNGVLKCIRIGSGESREISIVQTVQ